MPLFGGEKRQAANDALAAELDRARALSLPELAEHTLTMAFAPAAEGAWLSLPEVAGALIPGDTMHGLDDDMVWEMNALAGEGLQVAEHANLVRFSLLLDQGTNTNYHLRYTLTRLGRTALAQHTVRQAVAGPSAAPV